MIKHVKVIAEMNEQGSVLPLCLYWDDGRKYLIDKVLDQKKLASTKGGGFGIRYLCKIKGQSKSIYLCGYRWWVELPD